MCSKTAIFFGFFLYFFSGNAQEMRVENQTIAYADLISDYQKLEDDFSQCRLLTFGETDSGKPLHLFLINSSEQFNPEAFQNKSILFVMNGIHPGEPCGIDASLLWAKEMLNSKKIPENVVIAIIPVYNVGGLLNRGCCSRANQNGPIEHGFRGNARNLDLNRDFIKNDSKNSESFTRLFHWLKPHIFIDTHTSNGADYQYTMTLLSPRKERLNPVLANFLKNDLEPYIYSNYTPLAPYVNVFGTTPNSGINAFNDMPRFSTGYASLFNCIGFTTEAHMWKPFDDRVEYTLKFLQLLGQYANANSETIIENKRIADASIPANTEFVNLKLDTTKFEWINFLSYAPEYVYSDILGRDLLQYNRDRPEEIEIKYFNDFDKIDAVRVPKYYVVKGSWKEVVSRLKSNKIQMEMITEDTLITGTGTYITNFKSVSNPYEGHYLHSNMQTKDSLVSMSFDKGDYLISTQQMGWRFILNVLEPISEDSYFAWNFYDEITQQKEWYSSYVFEPYAKKMLEENTDLKAKYDKKMVTDSLFLTNGNMRLYWLYTQSPFYEKEHNLYPVLKVY